jgi:hypothetical protein
VRNIKFEGRRISHQWIVDEATGEKQWYTGTVLETVEGVDGKPGAVYDILYDGDDEAFTVDHLLDDYASSSVKFVDL